GVVPPERGTPRRAGGGQHLVIEVLLFDERQQKLQRHADALLAVAVAVGGGTRKWAADGGQLPVGVVTVVGGQAELLEVVGALDAGGGLAHLLHRRQQQADQHGDD